MLSDPQYDHWPIVSIASMAFRNKRIIACLFSWYKYARIFGITKKLVKKDMKTEGLNASYPNEYLHEHAPKTPYEVYFDLPLGFDMKQRRKEAVQDRIRNNKSSKCIRCKDG